MGKPKKPKIKDIQNIGKVTNRACIKKEIGFYLNNRDKFKQAAAEFAKFLCQASPTDLDGGTRTPWDSLCKTLRPRYDNAGLYVENGVGKIGLIDIEAYREDPNWYDACITALHFFPHHLENIMEATRQFRCTDIDDQELSELLQERDKVLKFFKVVYQDHEDFLKKNKIDFADPAQFPDLTDSRKQEITKAVVEWMRRVDCEGEPNLLKKEGDTIPQQQQDIQNVEQSLMKILDAVVEFIREGLKESIQSFEECESTMSTYVDLATARTVQFEYNQTLINSNLTRLMFSQLDLKYYSSYHFLKKLQNRIFQEMVGKEIAYYNPQFRYQEGSHSESILFC